MASARSAAECAVSDTYVQLCLGLAAICSIWVSRQSMLSWQLLAHASMCLSQDHAVEAAHLSRLSVSKIDTGFGHVLE